MSHYDELGVAPDATAADLRQAYRARAARLHPDKHAGGSAEELAAAEGDMRTLNEAWQVLSDAGRRRRYDETLLPPSSTAPGVRDEPAYRPVEQPLNDVGHRAIPVLILPVVLLCLALVAIFIFTAYAPRSPGSGAASTGASASGSVVPVAGDCVIVRGGHASQVVPCDEPNDGQVTAEVDRGHPCAHVEESPIDGPSGSTSLCLAPTD